MSPEETSEKLRQLPHMTEEFLTVLSKHGITTPEKLLAAINDPNKWKAVHPELKGIGPKTAEKWKAVLSGQPLPAEKPVPVAVKQKAQAVPAAPKVQQRQVVKRPVEPKQAEAPVKPVEVKKIEEKPKPAVKVEKKPEPSVVKAPEPVKEKPVKIEKKPEPAAEKTEKKLAAKKEKAEKKEKEESAEIVEEGGYVPNQKPKLSPELIDALKKRAKVAETRPDFYRQEYGRRKRLQTGWRKPRGIHSKTRMKMRYRRPMVSIGYAGPKLSKGLHPSGFREVRVFNVNDLSKISDADQQAARIGHGVGQRKREMIVKKADELGIRVLNRG